MSLASGTMSVWSRLKDTRYRTPTRPAEVTDDELWSKALELWQGSDEQTKLILEKAFPHMQHYTFALNPRSHPITQMMLDHPDCTEIVSIVLMMFGMSRFYDASNTKPWDIIRGQLPWAEFKGHCILQLSSMRKELEALEGAVAKRDEDFSAKGQSDTAVADHWKDEVDTSDGMEFRASQTSQGDVGSPSSLGISSSSDDSGENNLAELDAQHSPIISPDDGIDSKVSGTCSVETDERQRAGDARTRLPEARTSTESATKKTPLFFGYRTYVKDRLREDSVPVDTARIRSKEGWEEYDRTVKKALFEACDIQSQLIDILLQERRDFFHGGEKAIDSLNKAVEAYKTATSHKFTSSVQRVDRFTQQRRKAFDEQRELLQASMEKMIHYSIANWDIQAAEAVRQFRKEALEEVEKTNETRRSKDGQVEAAVEQLKEQVGNAFQLNLNQTLEKYCGIELEPRIHCSDLHVGSGMDSKHLDIGETQIPVARPLKRPRID